MHISPTQTLTHMFTKKVPLMLLFAGFSQYNAHAQAAPSSTVEQPATLYFYQDRVYGFLYPKYRVYADGKLLCKLGRNSSCKITLPAGTKAFTAKIPVFTFGTPPSLTLALEPGKSYYLQGGIASEAPIPGLAYGFTEVVPNPIKLQQIARSKALQPLASSAQ